MSINENITIDPRKIEEVLNQDIRYENILIANLDEVYTPDELNKISEKLKEGGKLEITYTNELDINSLISNLKFAGFMKLVISEENKNVTCNKKVWNKNRTKKTENSWKAMKIEETSEFVKEDELIDPFDSYQKFSKPEDCITKPKPCKNCNCGRADKETQEKQKQMDPNFKPECGKCYLGDAYRCQGCPYRGTPAFEPGDKIEFKNFIQADENIEAEMTNVNIKDSKVKIEI
jgi:DNA polymerase III delta prime subunit